MAINRMKGYQKTPAAFVTVGVQASVSVSVPTGFVVCSPFAAVQSWQQQLYRLAYEEARARLQVPRHHRLLSAWN